MIKVKAPGRICLFGEHQDYLNYPIISMAISKYIYLQAERITEPKFLINEPDIDNSIEIPLNSGELEYESNRDYLISGYNQFIRRKCRFEKGYKIKITGDIPINSGVASSSALVIAWLYFLNLVSGKELDSFQIALEGYNTEVKEFKEGGGMMDHFTSVFGNLIFLQPKIPKPNLFIYNLPLEGFVLGDSKEKKATVDDLLKTKNTTLKAFKILKEIMPFFDQFHTKLKTIEPYLANLKNEYKQKIIGNIINRDITLDAKELIDNQYSLISAKKIMRINTSFYQELGNLINLHQQQLNENIKISTEKINNIIINCLKHGAYGCKINGSGFGGTMFALLPYNEQLIKNAIEEAGGEGYILKTSLGVGEY
ncbi:MAG: mevalonate kinase [Promethearchaeota archaeon]